MQRRRLLKAAGAVALATPALLASTKSGLSKTESSDVKLSIKWLGGATMLITCGDLTFLTDPCFGDGEDAFVMGDPNEMFDLAKGPNIKTHRRLAPFPGIELEKVDHLFLSHLHEDHFDQKAEQSLRKNLPILLPKHDLEKLTSKGFTNSNALGWGDQHVLKKGDVTVTITTIRADHSENPEIADILGGGNGYWFVFERGNWRKSVYWTGDTFPTPPVLADIRPLGPPDILIPHLGAVGTTGPLGQISMGARHVRKFVEALGPSKVLPIHHSTYGLYLEPIHELAVALNGETFGLDLVSQGTMLAYN